MTLLEIRLRCGVDGDLGELAEQVKKANAAYGFGKGAEETLSREQAMTLEVFTSQVLDEYMK